MSLFCNILLNCLLLLDGSSIITGRVIKVSDGDTITILTEDNKQIRIRLEGIDAPEKTQPYGNKAKQFVSDLCYNKEVKVKQTGTDRYIRILGIVYVHNINVNEELIFNGLAWHYKQYNKSTHLDSLESIARSKKLNIWSLKDPTPPWQYRKNKRNIK